MTLTQIKRAGLDEIALDHVFTVGASGTDHYTFQGEGLNGTVNDPTLYLTRGKTYRFEKGSAHPLRIQSTSGSSGTAYNTGVTNNGGTGTVIIEVQHDAPDVLYYQCTSHPAMNGILYITGALADGGVTTAKIADDAVNNDKLANSVVATIAANTAKTSNATHTGDVTGSTSLTIANDAVTTAKIADDAVTQSKIPANAIGTAQLRAGEVTSAKLASNSVTSAQITADAIVTAAIQDQAVTLAKLPHGTSSNNGKFLRANNGGDPTFETVSTDLVADTSPQLGGNLDGNGHTIDLSGNTDSMILPKGTTEQRDNSPVAGELRFNTDTNAAELYNGTDWAKVGSTVVEADYLVIAGGGAGGSWFRGGGGGAGGYRSSNSNYGSSGGGNNAEATLELNKNTAYSVIVGAGGVGTNSTSQPGPSGSNSEFAGIEAIGGGGGGCYQVNGTSGGSGGGGGGNGGSTQQSGTTNQGYAGGVGAGSTPQCGGGGGGAGGAGYNGGSGGTGGDGGSALTNSITGTSVARAGGGGAGAYDQGNNYPVGGGGGAGDGGYGYQQGKDATANTGSGGGGCPGATGNYGGDGGSGVVIFRIPSDITATFTSGVTQASGSPATVGNDKVYTIIATTGTSQTVTFT